MSCISRFRRHSAVSLLYSSAAERLSSLRAVNKDSGFTVRHHELQVLRLYPVFVHISFQNRLRNGEALLARAVRYADNCIAGNKHPVTMLWVLRVKRKEVFE
ncbi:hypothetical protein GOODEAATRI_007604 [Goodea atripinnis]|uniref:Uncharacterized protein n=1 Tax=Goodea atripinnis TaxID=208336 RepID=A0ABV0PLX5_9TELE